MIGKVPDGWRVEKLENLCDVATGKKDANHGVENGQYLFFTCAAKPIKSNTYSFEGKSIILAGNGANVGLALYYDGKFEAYQRTYILNNFTENSRYIFYNLKRYWIVHNESKQFGSATNYIKMDNITKYPILIPPLPQQEKIVKVLDISSALIEKQKELIQKYDLFLKSKFIEMFGDPISNPMGWRIEKFESYIDYIGDIGSNGSNAVISKNLKMLDTEDYALMIRTTNLNKNDFINDVKYVSKETYDFFKKSKIFGGEIIMNKIGSAGKFWLMPYLDRPVSLGLNQLVIRLKNLNTKFLYYLLSTDYGKTLIASKTNGAVTQSITKGAVKDIDIMIPPIELQNKFASIVEKTEQIKEQETKKLEHLQTLHNSLMDKAFKGEIA